MSELHKQGIPKVPPAASGAAGWYTSITPIVSSAAGEKKKNLSSLLRPVSTMRRGNATRRLVVASLVWIDSSCIHPMRVDELDV